MKPSRAIEMRHCLFFGLCLMAMITSCGRKTDESIKVAGISKELADLRSGILSKINYNLQFDIPGLPEDSIPAKLTLDFFLKPSKEQILVLDFNAPIGKIKSIKSSAGGNIRYEHVNEHLLIPIEFLHENAFNTLQIEFIAGETGLNKNKDFIYTLLVPDRASTVFPCFDQPDLKATYQLALIVPKSWEAVSSTHLISDSITDQRRKYVFGKSDPMSTYHFSFVVGKFKKVVDNTWRMPMTMYHRETDTIKVARNAPEIFKLHRHALAWLEEYTGIAHPFQKFDFVLIPSFQYGGMEHVGAIQYRSSSLMLESAPTSAQLLGRASLIAHETAHMWFGNLVTMRWFNDVWMKEVFANFMAAKIVNPFFPDLNHDLRFLLAHYPAAYSVDRTAGTHAIRQPLENLKQAGSLYGPIIYQKAPIVMRMLEGVLGESNFRAGMQEYLKTYAYKSADWDDLIEILDSKTSTDLEEWSQIWVDSPGRPVLKSSYHIGDVENYLKLEQVDETGQDKTWPQSFVVDFNFPTEKISRSISFEDRPISELTITDEQIKMLSVNLDANGMAYGVFDFGDEIDLGIYPFGYALLNANLQESPLARAVLYLQLYEFFLYKKQYPPSYPFFIERYLFREQEKLNIELLLGHIETVFWRWMSTADRETFAPRYEFMLQSLMEAAIDPSLKYTYFQTLISIASSEKVVGELHNIWKSQANIWGLVLAERDYLKLAEQLALKMPSESKSILEVQLSRLKNPDQVDRLKFIMPAFSDNQQDRNDFFKSLAIAKNRQRESWVLDALRVLHHPLRAVSSQKYLQQSLELLEEIQVTGDIFFPKRWLDESFWGHQSTFAKETVDQFLATRPAYNPRLRNKILQATDMLGRVVEMRQQIEARTAKGD